MSLTTRRVSVLRRVALAITALATAVAVLGIAPAPVEFSSPAAASTSYDPNGPEGTIYRLYRAYFLREPDRGGFDYWLGAYRNGYPLNAISNDFARSEEFQQRYGNVDNRRFLELVYQNVLGRAPDQDGYAYWLDHMNRGMLRGYVMIYFSDSKEFRSKTARGVPPGYTGSEGAPSFSVTPTDTVVAGYDPSSGGAPVPVTASGLNPAARYQVSLSPCEGAPLIGDRIVRRQDGTSKIGTPLRWSHAGSVSFPDNFPGAVLATVNGQAHGSRTKSGVAPRSDGTLQATVTVSAANRVDYACSHVFIFEDLDGDGDLALTADTRERGIAAEPFGMSAVITWSPGDAPSGSVGGVEVLYQASRRFLNSNGTGTVRYGQAGDTYVYDYVNCPTKHTCSAAAKEITLAQFDEVISPGDNVGVSGTYNPAGGNRFVMSREGGRDQLLTWPSGVRVVQGDHDGDGDTRDVRITWDHTTVGGWPAAYCAHLLGVGHPGQRNDENCLGTEPFTTAPSRSYVYYDVEPAQWRAVVRATNGDAIARSVVFAVN